MSLLRRTAVAAAAAGGMIAGATPPAAIASTSSAATLWHLTYRAPRNYELWGIAAAGRTQAWAYGDVANLKTGRTTGFFYLHWNGKSWRTARIAAARSFVPEQIEASSASNVWIFGYRSSAGGSGTALVYNGRGWHAMAAPWPNDTLAPEIVAGPDDAWVVSSYGESTTTVEHWTGSAWVDYTVSGQVSLAGGGSRPWLVGTTTRHGASLEVVYRWTGSRWQRVSTPGYTAAAVDGAAAPDGRVWLVTRGRGSTSWRLYERRGSAWFRLASIAHIQSSFASEALIYDGHNGFWDLPYRWTGTRWVATMPSFPSSPWWFNQFWYNNVSPVPGTGSAWALVLANTSPTAGTQVGAIACYGPTP
jgi:hypothetical protein